MWFLIAKENSPSFPGDIFIQFLILHFYDKNLNHKNFFFLRYHKQPIMASILPKMNAS